MTKHFFLISSIIILNSKPIDSGLSYNLIFIWNSGYSNYITKVNNFSCTHFDPGGTVNYPQNILIKLCKNKKNTIFSTHTDRFHTNFIKLLKKNFLDILENRSVPESKILNINLSHDQTIRNLNPKGETILTTTSHLNKNDYNKLFVQITKNKTQKFSINRSLLLPNHGQNVLLNNYNLFQLKNFKMIITGSQTKSYQSHPTTLKKFNKINKPLIQKNIWGHLILKL